MIYSILNDGEMAFPSSFFPVLSPTSAIKAYAPYREYEALWFIRQLSSPNHRIAVDNFEDISAQQSLASGRFTVALAFNKESTCGSLYTACPPVNWGSQPFLARFPSKLKFCNISKTASFVDWSRDGLVERLGAVLESHLLPLLLLRKLQRRRSSAQRARPLCLSGAGRAPPPRNAATRVGFSVACSALRQRRVFGTPC